MQLVHTSSPALRHDLDACASHAPEFDHGLSDHLPMQLHAMHALGAGARRLADFATFYERRLGARQAMAMPDVPWCSLRGDIDAFDSLAKLFAVRIASEGRDAVLRDVLPALMPGVGGGAFHGLIRVGHAIAANHDGELANGLAYWAAGSLPLLPYDERRAMPVPTLDLAAWVVRAHDLTTMADTEPPRIVLRMGAWATAPQFAALATALRADEVTIDRMAYFAATLYVQTGNFTVMHMVTSAHALLVLKPWLTDPVMAARWFGVALFAAFRAARLTPAQIADAARATASPDPAAGMPLKPWGELATLAIASDDDHAAKIVYSSRALFEMFGDTIFHAAATRGAMTQA